MSDRRHSVAHPSARRAVFAVAAGVLALLASAPIAAADDTPGTSAAMCPNEGVRAEQGSTRLLDCRGWELISPVDGSAGVLRGADFSEGAVERAALGFIGPADGATTGATAVVRATRTANGWVSEGTTPPASELLAPIPTTMAVTPDLSGFLQLWKTGYTGSASPDSFLARVIDRHPTVLQHFGYLPGGLSFFVASDDLAHVFVADNQQTYGFGETPGSLYVYDFGTGTPNLVSRMPDDSVPACGVPDPTSLRAFPVSGVTRWRTHVVSTDGRRAFFHTAGDDCAAQPELYMRDLVAGRTTLISGPLTGGSPSGATFVQATPDGSQAFFLTADQLDTDDTDATLDLYRYTVGGGNECLTCGAVPANLATPAFNGNRTPRVAEDGSRAYFNSATVLAPGGTGNQNDIYVWRKDGSIAFVAPSNGLVPRASETTEDGSVLIFRSNNPALNALTGSDNGFQLQYYRYDDRDGSLTCMSCPQDGSTARGGVSLTLFSELGTFAAVEDRHAMSADGSIVAFATTTPLDPVHDVNNGMDIYEWHDGKVGLITDGTSSYWPFNPGSEIALIDVSRDGRNIVFANAAKLTHDPLPAHPATQLYTARIGGGFAPIREAACEGEGCRPALSPQTASGPPATEAAGPGNPKRRCSRHRRSRSRPSRHCRPKKHPKHRSRPHATHRRTVR